MIKRIIFVAIVLLTGMAANAQYRAEDSRGYVVKKIVFDREQVTEIRSDGSSINGANPIVINRVLVNDTSTVGIQDVTAEPQQMPTEYYDLEGRRVSDTEQMPCGIYLMKEGTKVRKIVKMR